MVCRSHNEPHSQSLIKTNCSFFQLVKDIWTVSLSSSHTDHRSLVKDVWYLISEGFTLILVHQPQQRVLWRISGRLHSHPCTLTTAKSFVKDIWAVSLSSSYIDHRRVLWRISGRFNSHPPTPTTAESLVNEIWMVSLSPQSCEGYLDGFILILSGRFNSHPLTSTTAVLWRISGRFHSHPFTPKTTVLWRISGRFHSHLRPSTTESSLAESDLTYSKL
jgi:hypothetical protein